MSPTRRLHGIAALSAAALATAGVAGQAVAADECTDLECLFGENALQLSPADLDGLLTENVSLNFIRSMMEAQGLPPETIDQTLAFYELMAIGETEKNLADGFPAGSADGLEGLVEMYTQLGLLAPGQDLNDLFAFDFGSVAFPKLEDPGEEAFVKVELSEEAFDDLGGAVTVAEAALVQAAADGDIDQATLDAILQMLPDE